MIEQDTAMSFAPVVVGVCWGGCFLIGAVIGAAVGWWENRNGE